MEVDSPLSRKIELWYSKVIGPGDVFNPFTKTYEKLPLARMLEELTRFYRGKYERASKALSKASLSTNYTEYVIWKPRYDKWGVYLTRLREYEVALYTAPSFEFWNMKTALGDIEMEDKEL